MSSFDVRVDTTLTPEQAWRAVTDWSAHSLHMPFTQVVVTRDVGGLGDEFVATTRIGPLVVEDTMVVTGWVPVVGTSTGTCEITKTGGRVGGGARITVTAHPGGAHVDWNEQVTLAPTVLAAVSGPFVGVAGRLLFGRAVRGLLADAARALDGADG